MYTSIIWQAHIRIHIRTKLFRDTDFYPSSCTDDRIDEFYFVPESNDLLHNISNLLVLL